MGGGVLYHFVAQRVRSFAESGPLLRAVGAVVPLLGCAPLEAPWGSNLRPTVCWLRGLRAGHEAIQLYWPLRSWPSGLSHHHLFDMFTLHHLFVRAGAGDSAKRKGAQLVPRGVVARTLPSHIHDPGSGAAGRVDCTLPHAVGSAGWALPAACALWCSQPSAIEAKATVQL